MGSPANFSFGVAALSEIGIAESGEGREYLKMFGFVEEDVSVVVKVMKRWLDDEHSEATSPSSAMWTPIHTWRALGEMRAHAVVVDPSVWDRACEALASALGQLSAAYRDLNVFLVVYLADLVAVEHAGLIERAFKAGVVNEFVCGDWSRVAFDLGVGPALPHRSSLLEKSTQETSDARVAEAPRAARPKRPPKLDKAARKRQRKARKKSPKEEPGSVRS